MADQPELFEIQGRSTVVLTEQDIKKYVGAGLLITRETFDPGSVESCSYDVCTGNRAVIGGTGKVIDLEVENLILAPGSYAGVISKEKLQFPQDVFARIGSKRFFAYEGVILLTGAIVDPGYVGHLLFGIYNASSKKVVLRHRRKICNVVFEKLSESVPRKPPPDPSLVRGDFPDEFLNRMANLDVLPWLQISERVKQIEQITKDILDLKTRYEDVLDPIKRLTQNVGQLTEDVKSIASQVGKLDNLVGQNSQQISQVTSNLQMLIGEVGIIKERSKDLQEDGKTHQQEINDLAKSFGRFSIWVNILWAVILVALSVVLTWYLTK